MKENNKNTHKLSIRIKREVRLLTKEDIDCLITARNEKIKLISKIKMFYINCSEWIIVISKNDIIYELSLRGIKKIKYAHLDIDYILDDGFSDEEIDMFLFPKKETQD